MASSHQKDDSDRAIEGAAHHSHDEATFRLVVESAPCGMLMVNEAGTIMLVNASIEKLFGYSRDALVGQPVEILIPDRHRAQYSDMRKSFCLTPTVRALGTGQELAGRHKDGTEIPLEVGLTPLPTPAGVQALASVVDITEQKQRAEEQLRFIIESSPNAILKVSQAGKIVLVNSQIVRMFGYAREELIGQSIEILIPERFRSSHEAQRKGFSEKPAIREMGAGRILQALRKDGSEFQAEIALTPLSTAEGVFALASITDVTERLQAENVLKRKTEDLERSNAELEQFAYVASHDLQEPLRMVTSYCDLLARRYKGKLDKDADDFLAFAIDGATRMKQLIEELLHYSRVGREGKPLVPTDCGTIVQVALDNLQVAIEETHASIACDPLPTVLADSLQLTQVFQNLIGNALKFRSDQPPSIHISAQCPLKGQDQSQWVFAVRDNGIGFEQQFGDRIFTIFQRLHNREEYPGSGMGLAITKKLIERHGGRIWAESAPGEGSTFFFTLQSQSLNKPSFRESGPPSSTKGLAA